ncbi:MAG: virulence factor [Pirellulales bacterium]
MATYKILYWQEVPSQVFADDGENEINLAMPPRFMERIDEVAVARGLSDGDDYLDQWKWGDELERDGTAEQVAQAVVAELEAQADWKS